MVSKYEPVTIYQVNLQTKSKQLYSCQKQNQINMREKKMATTHKDGSHI